MTTPPSHPRADLASKPRPSGITKRLLDAPVWMYRHGLGGLLGSRLVVLVHRGRRTGRERRTSLEVLQHRPVGGEYRVISGWGRTSDWYRNLAVNPPVALLVGRSRYRVTHRILPPDEAVDTVRGHVLAHPRATSLIAPDLAEAHESGRAALRRFVEEAPVVGFRPVADATVGGTGVIETLAGAIRIAGAFAASPVTGDRRLSWGATPAEVASDMPGDHLVEEPAWSYTYGITIDTPPARVWPWIVQIGQGRAGFYSYQGLENLIGCRIENVASVLPEHQDLGVGDGIRLHPTFPPMSVEVLDPPHALVLFASAPGPGASGATTWQFEARPHPRGTRLLVRGRSRHADDTASRLSFGRYPVEPISSVMNRKMIGEIKRLAETGPTTSD